MTLPKKLQDRRNELALKRASWQASTGNKDFDRVIQSYIDIGFEDGFEACYAEMQPLIEALKFYANGRHLWAESEVAPEGVNVCPPIGGYAREALKKIGVEE